jgi:hypothetical protein
VVTSRVPMRNQCPCGPESLDFENEKRLLTAHTLAGAG